MTRLRKYVIRCIRYTRDALERLRVRLDDKNENFLAEHTKKKDPRFDVGDRYVDRAGRRWLYIRKVK